MLNPSSSEIVSLFTRALACSSDAERAALLDQTCGDNRELREQIESLLEAHRQAGGFLEPKHDPQETVIASSYVAGAVIGQRYKLLEEIAEGGMGTVWLAEQTEPVRRRVAVKLIKPGMDSRQVLFRFEAERQALAVMDHPHIAKVLDGGVTEQGRPYFVMEYVKGVPITQFCDQARLNVKDRLRLMTQVCQAVQHAHQKGIIHRDLKPSNILVCLYDGQPVPKVIDFGLAKALHQPLTEGTVFTSHGLMVGTPLYMSPEQAEFNNLDIDTRSDVYSLGVILYELLTGSTPLDKQRFKDAAIQEIVRLIKEEEPSKPSTKLSGSGELPSIAAQRSLEPAQLSKLIRGDLDWIVMKSLDKERSRRYETANGLAHDIERYLTDQPVEACPPSAMYKFRKFARRNRLMLGAAGGIAAALLVGIAVSTWLLFKALKAEDDAELARSNEAELRIQAEGDRDEAIRQTGIANSARRAEQAALDLAESRLHDTERERDIARQQSQLALSTLTSVIFDVQKGLEELPGGGEVRRRLLATSLEKLEQVTTEYVEQARVDETTLFALLDMGKLILRFGAGDSDDGFLPADESGELTAESLSAAKLAESFFLRSQSIAEQLVASDPENESLQQNLAITFMKLGDVSVQLGELTTARDHYLRSFEIRERLAANNLSDVTNLRDLALSHGRMGNVLLDLGHTEQALASYDAMYKILSTPPAGDSEDIKVQRAFASAASALGSVYLKLGQTEVSLQYRTEAVRVLEQIAVHHPESSEAQLHLAITLTGLASTRARMSQMQPALEQYQRALEIYSRLAAVSPTDFEIQRGVATCHASLGDVSLQLGQTDSAQAHFEESLRINVTLAETDPGNSDVQRDLASAKNNLGDVKLWLGDMQSAVAHYREALAMRESLAEVEPDSVIAQQDVCNSLASLGYVFWKAGDGEAARDAYLRMNAIVEQLVAIDPGSIEVQRNLALSYERLGDATSMLGDMLAARDYYQQCLDLRTQVATGSTHDAQIQRELALAYHHLGYALVQLHDVEGALPPYEGMHHLCQSLVAEDSSDMAALRLLAIACMNLGDANGLLGKFEQTTSYYSQALSSFESLAQVDPTNAEARRDLSIVYNKIGDVSLAFGRGQDAYDMFALAFEISGDLAEANPSNIGFQVDRAIDYHKLATAAVVMSDFELAVEHYQSAIDLLDRISPDSAGAEAIPELRQELSLKKWAVEMQAAEAQETLTDWETFVNQPDADSRLLMRIQLLAKEERFDEIPQTAERLRSLEVEDPASDPVGGFFSALLGQPTATKADNLYNAACGYAICANAIKPPDGAELTADEQTRRQEFIDLALACLRESIAAGWEDFEHMRSDPDLTVLHGSPEFEELMSATPMPSSPE